MPKIINLIGKRFYRLTVIEFAGINSRGEATWKCMCDCGGEKVTTGYSLRIGNTKSCGCLHKEITAIVKKKYNEFKIKNDYIEVQLSNVYKVMVCDVDDWDRLKEFSWYEANNGYAAANTNFNGMESVSFFHQIIISCDDGMYRDHINRNRLDNRKSNLRIVNALDNVLNRGLNRNNTSGYKGVYFNKQCNKWAAQIMSNRKAYNLGLYSNLNDAIQARLNAEKIYFGKIVSKQGVINNGFDWKRISREA